MRQAGSLPHDGILPFGHVGNVPHGAAAGHPGLEVELAIGRAAEVAAGRVDHAIGDAQGVEDLAFQVADLVVHRLALLRRGEGEHFDLGELVDAVDAARGPAVGSRLGAVAMANAGQPQRQLVFFQDLLGEQAAQRDFGRGHQAQIAVLDAVNLRLWPAWQKADAGEDFVAGQVGRDHRRVAAADEEAEAYCCSANSSSTASFLRK